MAKKQDDKQSMGLISGSGIIIASVATTTVNLTRTVGIASEQLGRFTELGGEACCNHMECVTLDSRMVVEAKRAELAEMAGATK